jgi:hypothetical protein
VFGGAYTFFGLAIKAHWKPLNRQHMYFSIASVTGFRAFTRLVFFSLLMDENHASVDGYEVISPSVVIIKFLGGGRTIKPITSVDNCA